ncbi:MAG: hypothetical protein ABR567_06530 [Myxococcales bacterium]|nr:hypothetical protein [Myxococcales bacterium]
MSYSVHYTIDMKGFSEGERRQVEQTMQQIAEVVNTVPKASPFWSSMKDSVLQIDVAGWRVGYRIDRSGNLVRVIEATKVR